MESESQIKVNMLSSDNAAKAAPTYSVATSVKVGDATFIFGAGCIGLDPKTSKLVSDDLKEQVTQSMENMKAILEDNGATLKNVTRCQLYCLTMDDFAAINEVYATFFPEHLPARACVAVKELPLGAKFEILCDAVL
ncbi:unnamed protein product [Moneuplotes crassus]|uniref:Uncharacterized protein n=2 Tax=Euplotes crassus TaxID=5936 RepID=A0AAD1Y044_EUPCR|nr:unnamed protein product [Moneuplotes crassus]